MHSRHLRRTVSRRRFIELATAGLGGLASAAPAAGRRPRPRQATRPNILLLLTDQQLFSMMSCTGNRWLATPAMDALAAAGTRFELTYVTNPVCSPSRFSLQTGRMPSTANISNNDDAPTGEITESMLETSLGRLFRGAGYDTVYGGKVHLPEAFQDDFAGKSYRYIDADERDHLVETCSDFIKSKHDRPFFLTASLINPHDICYLPIKAYDDARGKASVYTEMWTPGDIGELMRQVDRLGDRAAFAAAQCPPLPANHEIPALEPSAIADRYLKIETDPYRQYVREHWTDQDWRIYSWAYHRLTERVDRQIGAILGALREADLERNTLVVLTSDHGDLNGAHKLEHKSVLYEEAMRVPLILSYKGKIPEGIVDKTHLVSNGLDLLPTLIDYAGIDPPAAALFGRSLRPLLAGRPAPDWRRYVVVESQHDRAIRTARFKYCIYTSGSHPEQLTDLEKDPGEMNNLAEQAQYKEVLKEHRALLWDWVAQTWDYDFENHAQLW